MNNRNTLSIFLFVIALCSFFGCRNETSTMEKKYKLYKDDMNLILKQVAAFGEAWEKGDAKAAAAFYTEDGFRVGAFGDKQRGRAEIEAAYNKLFHETMAGAKMTMEPGSVHMFSGELALWQGAFEIFPAGSNTPLKGYALQVMKKVNGRWLILEAHPKLYPSSPQKQ